MNRSISTPARSCPNCGAPARKGRMTCEYCGTDISRDEIYINIYQTAPDVEACRQLADSLMHMMETGAKRGRIF